MRPVNLLPEEHRPRRRGSSNPGSAYAVVGVLAALVGMVALFMLTTNQVSARKADAREAQADAARAQAQIARLAPFGDFTEVRQVRVASVKGLAQARFDWERFVRELALVLPKGTWLTEVDAATTAPEAGTPSSSTAAVGPHANLKGCAPRQPDVAKLLVRLRKVNRVNGVELAESAQSADAAAAGGSAGAAPEAAGCGRRYSFAITVAFDEAVPAAPGENDRAKVPVSLGGGQ